MGSYAVRILKILAIFMLVISANTSSQASQDDARKFIEGVSHDALAVITSDDSAKNKEAKLSKLFMASVDTKWIAKFTMGKHWREASHEQRDKYMQAYQQFLLGSYVPKFRQFNNQEIKILKADSDPENKNEYIVETQIIPKDGAAINVDYKVRKSENGKFIIYDMVAEGISLISTQRSDFASVLGRGGVEELIRMLKEKVA